MIDPGFPMTFVFLVNVATVERPYSTKLLGRETRIRRAAPANTVFVKTTVFVVFDAMNAAAV
jgi:hypothetical protein